MSNKAAIVSSFIRDAPPGELTEVVNDIKALTSSQPSLLTSQTETFKKYNETQFATVKLPGASREVLISPYNDLEDGRYYDTESRTSFTFDHVERKASSPQSHSLDSAHSDLINSLLKTFSTYTKEHFPSAAYGVFPTEKDTKIAIVLVANKYSPNNFWNGRYRSSYLFSPSSSSTNLKGTIHLDVHYYEDGNVRLLTTKDLSLSSNSSSAADIVKTIATAEKAYQEDLNRAFVQLSEGAFKGLRRQLPITRTKMEWEKVGGYRIGKGLETR